MMDLKPGYTPVYVRIGAQVTHILPPSASPNSSDSALCGRSPNLPDLWYGTGSWEEMEKAQILRPCIGCASQYRRVAE